MEVFTLKEWEENFDELYTRVEQGESIGIVREDGKSAVMMPADEAEFLRIHTTDNNDAD
jgi:antitoxin (DNA-binding transcriptional repressor) of toxin-antitoxin stability system|tara:strand:+ start:4715 stop:4891 length:177 start_codon:yes stop_codon:yes gene_type:complete